jgi:dTDP-4-amino-4,6-dideoxygalactose transaminase
LIARLDARGVAARRPVFRPLHLELGQHDREFPQTSCAHAGDVSLPLYPALRSGEIQQVVEAVRHALDEG